MRCVLFYSEVESFNYFTNQILNELQKRGHECFILDLRGVYGKAVADAAHSMQAFQEYIEDTVHLVICFDGLGLKEDLFIELWDLKQAVTVNILMDHPLRFHPVMEKHPKRYIQFCCDKNHVEYVKRYFGDEVEHVQFLPHAGTYEEVCEKMMIPYKDRKYDILFSGTYYPPQEQLLKVDQWFEKGTTMNQFYRGMAEYLLSHESVTTEQAVLDTIEMWGMQVSDAQLKTMFRCAEPIDWMVRMYHRERVIAVLAEAGFDIWLLGRGWEKHPSANMPNVHKVDNRIPFADTFPYMANAKINLNVMPWFKAGTHDRIFNILLQHSLPLTDSSDWIDENFVDGENIALYDLKYLERLPEKVKELLEDDELAERMIANGFEKVKNHFTWKQCVDDMLQEVENIFRYCCGENE